MFASFFQEFKDLGKKFFVFVGYRHFVASDVLSAVVISVLYCLVFEYLLETIDAWFLMNDVNGIFSVP